MRLTQFTLLIIAFTFFHLPLHAQEETQNKKDKLETYLEDAIKKSDKNDISNTKPENKAVPDNTPKTEQELINETPETVKKEPEPKSEPKEKVRKLSVLSWGGAYQKVQDRILVQPFAKAENLDISLSPHSGSLESLRTKLQTSENQPDLIDMTHYMVEQACNENLIKPINIAELQTADGSASSQEDFIKDGIHKCGVASMVWSSVIVYNKRAFKVKRRPSKAKDFFNTRRYRGKRALPKQPEYVLEFALLADGVSPDEVYALLETEKGIARAFKQLDKIKKRIIWWTSPAEAFELLKTGKASMAIGYSGRAFSVIAKAKQPFEIIWDGQIYDINYWTIAQKSSRTEAALNFISYATSAERLAQQSEWFPYGPARLLSFEYIEKHPEAGISLDRFLPTHPDNFKNALHKDQKWWTDNKERLDLAVRFEKWLNNEKYEPKAAKETENKTEETENNKDKSEKKTN